MPGLSREIYPNSTIIDLHCNDNNYILSRQNHQTGELEEISRQQDYRFTISNIRLNTSGVYCIHKQCSPKQCCFRISGSYIHRRYKNRNTIWIIKIMILYFTVKPETQLILPHIVPKNVQVPGVCYAKAWPMLAIHVFANDGCGITKMYSVSDNNTYTMAVLFTVTNITNTCTINCLTEIGTAMKSISIGKCQLYVIH